MRTYAVTHIRGHDIRVGADGVEFAPAFIIFWNGDRADLVWAIRTDAVAEVRQEQDT